MHCCQYGTALASPCHVCIPHLIYIYHMILTTEQRLRFYSGLLKVTCFRTRRHRAHARSLSPLPRPAQMALSSAQGSALLVLLEAPSKQAVDAFFCSCFRERHAAGPIDDARVAEIVESLGLSTPLVAAPLQRAAVALIGKVLYVDASAEQTAALFPPDFHSSLQALLTKVRPALALH